MNGYRFTGKDVKMTFGDVTAHFKTIEIMVKKEKWDAPSSDADTPARGTKMFDASIKVAGWDTKAAGGAEIGDLIAIVLANKALDALDFTDDGTTPASRLPASFWTKFPLAEWGLDEVVGKDYSQDPADWSCSLSPGNKDLAPA